MIYYHTGEKQRQWREMNRVKKCLSPDCNNKGVFSHNGYCRWCNRKEQLLGIKITNKGLNS